VRGGCCATKFVRGGCCATKFVRGGCCATKFVLRNAQGFTDPPPKKKSMIHLKIPDARW
jgi:hypothetical protein